MKITDHSLLRYLERVWGVDVEKARAEMMSAENAIATAAGFGCDLVKLGNGARLRLSGDTVVTTLPKRGR
jgi:hypothetical protein